MPGADETGGVAVNTDWVEVAHDPQAAAAEIDRLRKQLSRYQGGVEVEATVGYGSILQLELYPYSAGQRVRVLVMRVE